MILISFAGCIVLRVELNLPSLPNSPLAATLLGVHQPSSPRESSSRCAYPEICLRVIEFWLGKRSVGKVSDTKSDEEGGQTEGTRKDMFNCQGTNPKLDKRDTFAGFQP